MKTARWQRINALFDQVVDLPKDQRATVLDDACGGDTTLRRAVERRLRADRDAGAGQFLEESVEHAPGLDEAVADGPPEHLGPYRLRHEIGQGGMGTVYAAERDDETFRRRVAIKVIHAGTAPDGEVARRLRAERRILALLEHPHIARIYDGGTTGDGMPYLVMEQVHGVPIDRYCQERRLSIRDRVELMGKVCDAVHYAHRNLVVHRDLKPSNILVTDEGEPKLLDFGIAKVLDPETVQAPSADATAPWRRMLSVNYASPEQIRGTTISTASDVYSLGVLLFLLLTDELPHSFSGLSPWQVEQHLSTTEPPRPSVIVDDQAEDAGTDRRRVARLLRHDLDAITAKALRGDPEARYDSAQALRRDLDRYLRGMPVAARRGTWRYRTGKFLRRHRVAATATGLAAALGVGLIVSQVRAAMETAASEARLQAEQTKLQATVGFFLTMIEDAGPYVAEGKQFSLRDAVDRHAERMQGALTDQPEVRASVLSTLGWVYRDLGEIERAKGYHQEALDLRRSVLDEETLDVTESLDGLAATLRDAMQIDEAMALSQDVVARYRRQAPADHPLLLRGLNNHVKLLCMVGDWDQAGPLAAEAYALARQRPDRRDPEVHRAIAQQALVLRYQGETEGALALYQETLENFERRFGSEHPVLAPIYNNLGTLEASLGRLEQAVEHLRRADEQYVAAWGRSDFERVPPLTNLGKHLHALGAYEEAETVLREAIQIAETSPHIGPDAEVAYVGRPSVRLGEVLADTGRCVEVETVLGARIEAWEQRTPGRTVTAARAVLDRCRRSEDEP